MDKAGIKLMIHDRNIKRMVDLADNQERADLTMVTLLRCGCRRCMKAVETINNIDFF